MEELETDILRFNEENKKPELPEIFTVLTPLITEEIKFQTKKKRFYKTSLAFRAKELKAADEIANKDKKIKK